MIDIHSHILPGLDDGARTLDESVAMLRIAAAAGTTDIVASPHANLEFNFDPDLVESKIAEVQQASGPSPRIHYGCDFHLTMDNIQDAMANPEKYSINHKGYLLVEFSDMMIPKATGEIFARMIGCGLRPVVTHPERNPLLQSRLDEIEFWVQMGCLMQVTTSSLNGAFGRDARSTGEELLKRGLVHIVASDAHDCKYRPPVLNEAFKQVEKEYGEGTARSLLIENPRAILNGDSVQLGALPVRRKRWYQRL